MLQYHPEAVVVHRGRKCFYGRDGIFFMLSVKILFSAILDMFKTFSHKAGKCKAKVCRNNASTRIFSVSIITLLGWEIGLL